MQVKELLPKLYDDVEEMQAIANAEDNEFENHIVADINNSFDNSFINKANKNGLTKLEKLYSIQSSDSDTIAFRRQRLYARTISSLPFTERYLISKINSILGEGNWDYTINYNNYTLTINSLKPGKNWYAELLNFLKVTVPCNIAWTVNVYASSWGNVEDNFSTWEDLSDITWQTLKDGTW